MDRRFINTFSRHRRLFISPVILAGIVALWFAVGAPRMYESTASLWFDLPVDGQPVVSQNGVVLPPAAEGQQLLSELLTTRSFRLAVAQRSPLGAYVTEHPVSGWNPPALFVRLEGSGTLDERLERALGEKHVTLTVAGPQVLKVSLQAGTPDVASGALEALIARFRQERSAALRAQAQASIAYLQQQVDQASKDNGAAQTDLAGYVTSHPKSTVASDPTLANLTEAAQTSAARLANARNNLNQATVTLAAPLGSQAGMRVLDPPKLPEGPLSGKKKVLLTLLGGLLVGAIVSGFGVVYFSSHELPAVPALPLRGSRARIRRSSLGADGAAADGADGRKPERATVHGTIIAVRNDGQGRQMRPVWTLRTAAGERLELAEQARVAVAGTTGREGVVRALRPGDDGELVLELEITSRKLGLKGESGRLGVATADEGWVGAEVTLVEKRSNSAERIGKQAPDHDGEQPASEEDSEVVLPVHVAAAETNGASTSHPAVNGSVHVFGRSESAAGPRPIENPFRPRRVEETEQPEHETAAPVAPTAPRDPAVEAAASPGGPERRAASAVEDDLVERPLSW